MDYKEFFDADSSLYKTFEDNWLLDEMYESFEEHWVCYIDDLDIGIKFKERVCDIYAQGELYEVVDERKWMYARLKYGI